MLMILFPSISTENKSILTMKTVIDLALNLGVTSTRKSKLESITDVTELKTIFEVLIR